MAKKPPKLAEGFKANYETLLEAAERGDLALVSAIRRADQQPVALVCATNYDDEEADEFCLVPFAVMVEGDPFELFEDPTLEEEGDQEC